MRYDIPHKISLPLTVFVLIILVVATLFLIRQTDPRILDADKSYAAGESAATVSTRKQAFNSALEEYLDLEQDYNPQFGTGRLYYNIGNTYFQLEEYPLAVLYFLRAQALMPREEKVQQNLEITQDKLNLAKPAPANAFSNVFFFHSRLSLPERLQLFFGLSLFTLLFTSAFLWLNNRWIKNGIFLSLALTACMLLSLGYSRYISPIEAVIVRSTDLYRDAGKQYARANEQPLPAGSQVEVLDSQINGKWFKVRLANNDLGFIPDDAVRLVAQ